MHLVFQGLNALILEDPFGVGGERTVKINMSQVTEALATAFGDAEAIVRGVGRRKLTSAC